MGQKINPVAFRTGTFIPWKSRWFADDIRFREYLFEDIQIRKALMKKLQLAGISSVEIERLPKIMGITVTVSRPGVVIGRGGSGIEEVKKFIVELIEKARGKSVKDIKIDIKVEEIRNPELSAHLVATRIAAELERRTPHRRVVSKPLSE
jgi:small subunit ribosomal protein S3